MSLVIAIARPYGLSGHTEFIQTSNQICMKQIIITALIIICFFTGKAQNAHELVLAEIERNSVTLKALRQEMEMQILENKTGLTPTNPEVEFNYLWGSPTEIGKRKDFGISQEFDFPTAYLRRGKISNLENSSAELKYKMARIEILTSAQQACAEITYCNNLLKEHVKHLNNAGQIATMYRTKMDKGDANILEVNKANRHLSSVEYEIKEIETQKASLMSYLISLNGGHPIELEDTIFNQVMLPSDFEEWYMQVETTNPMLQYVRKQVEISHQEMRLSQAQNLPKLSLGYMQEKVVGEKYQGITAGATIPLWENKNQVKFARKHKEAAQTALEDSRILFYSNLKNLHSKAISLQENIAMYSQSIDSFNDEKLLRKALDAGEITLLDYLLEIEYYYEAIDRILKSTFELQKTVIELNAASRI